MANGKATITVDVLEDHPYDGVVRTAGTQYEAEADHVAFLTGQGWVRAAPTPPEPKPAGKSKKG